MTKEPTGLEKTLNLDYNEKYTLWLTSQTTLRRLIGILGLAMPVLLYIGLWIDTGHSMPLESISHYYMTRVNSIFVIIVSMLAIFLIIYKGEDPVDFYLSGIAGIFALCLLLFPTDNISNTCGSNDFLYSVTTLKYTHSQPRVIFHYVASGIFLASLASMSFFLFTRSKGYKTKEKIIRNRIYRSCAVIMLLCILAIASNGLNLDIINPDFYKKYGLTFWFETIAVWSFGFSWLVKGKTIMKD